MRATSVVELRRDADLSIPLSHATCQHILDIQFARNFLYVATFPLEGEAGMTRRDKKPSKPRQCIDDVLGYSICEVLLLRVRAQICKGQDCEGWTAAGVGRFVRVGARCVTLLDFGDAGKAITDAWHGD